MQDLTFSMNLSKFIKAGIVLTMTLIVCTANGQTVQRTYGTNCVGDPQSFTLVGCSNCSSFAWSATGTHTTISPSDGTSIGGFSWTAAGTGLSVTVNYFDGNTSTYTSSSYNNITMTAKVTPTVSLSQSGIVCAGSNVTFTATPVNGGTTPSYYFWRGPSSTGPWTALSSTGNTCTASFQNGEFIRVVMSSSIACINPSSTEKIQLVSLHPKPTTPNAGLDQSVTCGSTVTLNTSSSLGSNESFIWYRSDGSIVTGSGSSRSITGLVPAAGTNQSYTYTLKKYNSSTGCYSDGDNVVVTVNQQPAPVMNDLTLTCGVSSLLTASGKTGSEVYRWYPPTGSAVNDPYTFPGSSPGTYSYNVSRYNPNGCESPKDPFTVTVNNLGSATTASPVSGEFGTQITLNASGAGAGQTYRWYASAAGGLAFASNISPVLNYTTETYHVALYNSSVTGCESPTRTPLVVNVFVSPPPVPGVSSNTCGPKTVTLPAAPTNVTYYRQSSQTGTSMSYPVNPTSLIEDEASYWVRARSSSGIWSTVVQLPEGYSKVDAVDIVVNSYSPANTLVQATHSITLSPGFTVTAGNTFTARIAITSECNDFINWTEEIVYNESGQVIERTKGYYDGFGNNVQNQQVDYLSGKVWASQPLYDNLNEPSASTLPAPILEHDFIYKKKFVLNSSGIKYSASDFDGASTLNNPAGVAATAGTVGWYYSSNNTLEPLVATTSYPYSRSYIAPGPDPKLSTSAGVGEQYKMGSGHELISERQLTGSELAHYVQIKAHFPAATLGVSGYKIISTDPNDKQAVSFVDADARTLASATLNGSTYDNWSYNFYNDAGQLIASVAPNGVVIGNTAFPSFVTTYKYDQYGQMIETVSPDEGKSEFVYSIDGKLRFSQNELQRSQTPQKFSFTNYDYLGRLIESGEYTSDGALSGTNYNFQPHTSTATISNSVLGIANTVGSIGTSAIVDNLRCKQVTYVDYDYQTSDYPDASVVYKSNLTGQITRTKTETTSTWYAYDEFGSLIKTWQLLFGLGTKTIAYSYNYLGNVVEVAYQAGSADAFYHHYEYDTDNRLTKVYTSLNGVTKTLRATYLYYLHGPVKRIELGGNIQGIDYVYNLDGSLKFINHADPQKDPGLDGLAGANGSFMKDVFGEGLDYNTNDYSGAGYDDGTFTLSSSYPDQYAGAVKAIRWHSHVDNHQPRGYAFNYDNRYQLDKADFGSISSPTTGNYSFTGSSAYQEDIGHPADGPYDKNGNINGLTRKDKYGNVLNSFDYNYATGKNQLQNIAPLGGGAALRTYQYNSLGQMTQQVADGKTFNTIYNAYGLVQEIRDAANKLLQSYDYDDMGNRYGKTIYDPSTTPETALGKTFYVHDASGNVISTYYADYVGSLGIKQIEVPIYGAGRLAIYKPEVTTTFYEVGDHLGNVRGVIGVPETTTFTLTMENSGSPNPRPSELIYFRNIVATEKNDVNMNHTAVTSAVPSPSKSAYLLWIDGQSGTGLTQATGPAIMLKVEADDKIDIEVFAKFRKKTTGYSRTGIIGSIASMLANNYVGTAAGIDVLSQATSVFNDGTSALFSLTGGSGTSSTLPYAFVNALVYDKAFEVNTSKTTAKPATTAAGFEPGYEATSIHEQLTIPQITIDEPGYIYIYVSNESEDTEVWFDDLKITHQHSNVVAGADYYPLGLVMDTREITREDYRYGYQGQFSEKDITTGMQEFELRMYDPAIGRWLSPDPYGQFHSPYLAMGNSFVSGIDPDGGWWCCGGSGAGPGGNGGGSPPSGGSGPSPGGGGTGGSIISTVVNIASAVGNKIMNGAKNTGKGALEIVFNATDYVAGFNKSVGGDLSPDYYDKTKAGVERQTWGGRFGNGVQLIFLFETMTPTSFRSTPVLTTPNGNVPVTQPLAVTAPTTALDLHGRIYSDADLPTLDKTGKLHGNLPKGTELRKHSREALEILLKDLKVSVQNRIKATTQHGPDATNIQNRSHGQRQAAEQQLIRDIESYLEWN